jgi:transposase, IS5 family
MASLTTPGFFDDVTRLASLSAQGDPLEKLAGRIDWQVFVPVLERALRKEAKGPGGRPSYDSLLMFKILILQRYYNVSDEQTQYQITDRLSFQRFLGLRLEDRIPDQKTIWLFRDSLTKSEAIKPLFEAFSAQLEREGLLAHEGQIVDASFVDAPKQRNTREENETIKSGGIPEDWKLHPAKLHQKDTDARWTKKNNVTYYGYKNHVKVCRESKLITTYDVTDASVHDSQGLEGLLDDNDKKQTLHADSAYAGAEFRTMLRKRGIRPHIHAKGYRNKPLTKSQLRRNRIKSKIRARVEHVFGFIENSMNGSRIRSIGIERARGIVGLMNLTYNLFRCLQLKAAV